MISKLSRHTPIARFVAAALASAAGLSAGTPAFAQEAGGGLEEVLVTATRRASETDLQSTPVSVTAVTNTDIDRMVAHDISGVASAVPGFSAARVTAFNAASFAMRGVGITDIIVYQDSPVGVTVDDFVMPSVQTQLLDTYDIQSVEILRGPQGTLFGKNTTGGAVNIQTKRPNMTDWAGDVRLGYGSFDEKRAQGSVDIPIISDVLAVRVAAAYVKSDGYYKLGANYGPINTFSAFTDGHPFTLPGVTGQVGHGTGEDAGGEDVVNGRIKAQWNPNDSLTFLAQYEYFRDKSDAVPSFNDTPHGAPYVWNFLGFTRPSGDPLDHMASTNRHSALLKMDEGQIIDVDGYYLNMEWDLGSHTLFANAGRRDQDEHLPNTYTGAAPVNSITGEPLSLFDASRDTTRETTQYEIRLASNNEGRFNYVVGAFQQTNDAAFCVVQALGFIDLALDNVSLGVAGAVQQRDSVDSLQRTGFGFAGGLRRSDVRRHGQVPDRRRLPLHEGQEVVGRPHAGRVRPARRQSQQRQPVGRRLRRALCKRAISASIPVARTSTSRRQGSTTSKRSGRSRAGASRVRTSSTTSCSPT